MRTLLAPTSLHAGELLLEGDEAHHGLRVLRLVPGDVIRLVDGGGLSATAEVTGAGKSLRLRVDAISEAPPERCAALAVAVPQSRMPTPQRHDPFAGGGTALPYPSLIPPVMTAAERISAALP